MKAGEIALFLILRSIGNFLILFALFGIVMTFGPTLFYEVQYRFLQLARFSTYITDPITHMRQGKFFAEDFADSQSHQPKMIPIDTLFDILIPKIGANSSITANVDAGDSSVYLPILKHSVAHAKGSALPDENGTVYLFAHSTDNWWDVGVYNAVFYLLKELTRGDSIQLVYKNKEYKYTVTDTKIVDPNSVGYLVNSQKTGKQLILQTCWPPGTTWKRLLVIAKP